MMYFNKDFEGVYILLGKACDLNCTYCFQGDSHEPYVNEKINPDILDFIRDMVKQQNTDEKFIIKFFGGEPLLYFDKIKYIVEDLQDIADKVDFWTLTNGRLLNEEMVEFFNEHFPSIGVSWDGDGSKYSRGYNVMDHKRDLLLKLKHLSFSTVFHKYNYPLEFYNQFIPFLNEFTELNGFPCDFVSAPITECGNPDPMGLKFMDLNRVKKESLIIHKRFAETFEKPANEWNAEDRFIAFHLIEDVAQTIKSSAVGERKLGSDRIEIINVDLQGNLYTYHEFYSQSKSSHKLGDIYMNFFDYCKAEFETDQAKSCMDSFGCRDCVVSTICRDKAAANQTVDTKTLFCNTTRYLYGPAVELINKLLKRGAE